MTKNIKEIGKELLGKSLNSFHRKTGLTQLEENNKMQDGILDGILSQVDDAYIEKTEQSNVIHLEGSGDGVVVIDGIEGNTRVNIAQRMETPFNRTGVKNTGTTHIKLNYNLKPNTTYTRIIKVDKITLGNFDGLLMCDSIYDGDGTYRQYKYVIKNTGFIINQITTPSSGTNNVYVLNPAQFHFYENSGTSIDISSLMIIEGTEEENKDIVNYFEGLQSSFEEKVNDQGKYEIEILSKNKNLLNFDNVVMDSLITEYKVDKSTNSIIYKKASTNGNNGFVGVWVNVKPNTDYALTYNKINGGNIWIYTDRFFGNSIVQSGVQPKFNSENNSKLLIGFYTSKDGNKVNEYKNVMLRENNSNSNFTLPKQNKIKLLLDEPLRSLPNGVRDRLCVVNNKLVVERMCKEVVLNGKESDWSYDTGRDGTETKYFRLFSYRIEDYFAVNFNGFNNFFISDRYKCETASNNWKIVSDTPSIDVNKDIIISVRDISSTLNEFKEKLSTNNIKLVYQLSEPHYEEVLNEYGEPILLEGYENGTIYIDSTIIPTTTVRYTPKMESFKTLKEVENNNIMLTNDVNDNIIPYMMDVDLMIMEKEMALMSHKNIRKMEVLDMTSMQKRTQDMLERLIKGKTLTEQECKTRIITYLHAGKITDEQAEELMLLIDEVYA